MLAQLLRHARAQIGILQPLQNADEFGALLRERLLRFRQLWLARALENAPALGVDTLPLRTLAFDPVAARAAHLARRQALADDAFESELVAVIE